MLGKDSEVEMNVKKTNDSCTIIRALLLLFFF